MKKTVFILGCIIIGIAILLSISSEPRENPLLYEFNEIIQFGELKKGDITKATDHVISEARIILDKIISLDDGKQTFKNTIRPIDDIEYIIEKVWSPASLMGATHPEEIIRNEGDSCSIRVEKFLNELSSNEDLYNALFAYSQLGEAKSLSGAKKKYLEDKIRDFNRSGFGLNKEKREFVRGIKNRLANIGLEFRRNISSYQDTLFISEEESAGLTETFKKERLQKDGTYAIDMSYPSYFTFMKYAESNNSRKALYYKFLNRASKKNIEVLDDMLRYRKKLADILGYDTFAEYRTEILMAKNPERVWNFENELKESLYEKAVQEYAAMLEIKSAITGEPAEVIFPYEKRYYQNKLLEEEYQVDEEEVKSYFELNNVINGLFTITQQLFNITYCEVDSPSVWHKDVRMFEVFDDETDELIGRFYLDLFPRPNKYHHAAAFSVVIGKMLPQGYQKPVYTLVCNFPKPTQDQPSLLTHDNVETFFHEFGHLLHGLLTKSELIKYAGTGVVQDFVEAPSQMLENWVWNKESLSLFAIHYETGEVIPEELVDKMLAAKNLNSALNTLQQVFYGVLDFTLHDGYNPDGEITTTDILRELQNEITFYPYQEGTYFQTNFGHLKGYAAAYYGYLWSEVYAQDMFSVFEARGILDSDTGMLFRKIILEKGGTEDPFVLVSQFLGREPNNRAFLKSLGLNED